MTDEAVRGAVLRLVEEGQSHAARGDHAAAADAFGRGCALVRGAMAAEPGDLANPQQLGSMLYAVGEWRLRTGEHDAAIVALAEAESAYGRLGAEGVQFAADVVLRRARVHALAGHPLSALADAQQAVLASLERAEEGGSRTDAARVIALAAQVQLMIGGDPDLAVAAADWALREYLSAFRAGDRFELPAEHAAAVEAAGGVAFLVHTTAGRVEVAEMARWFVTTAEGTLPETDAVVEQLRAQPTLAWVLGAAGRADLAGTLTGAPADVAILVPAMRCPAQLAPVHAGRLTELQVATDNEDDEVLLGLEAHALFAAASQAQVPAMRYEFGHFGQQWGAAVVNVGQRLGEAGDLAATLDAAGWLTGIIGQLVPHALVDRQARATVLDLAAWQQDVYTANGDTETAARVAEGVAALATITG